MYTKHFNLNALPFENVPDPRFFFDQGDYTRIRHRIEDSLEAGRGLIVVSGPIGSGKTTESQVVISDFSKDTKIIWMAEPPESSNNLFLFIAQELGLQPTSTERVFILRDLKDALMKMHSEGRKCLLIIDESHLMSDELLNGIRLLNNLEEGSLKLIQIFLLGQEELIDSISRPEMENLKQRISTMEIMGKMNSDAIRQYVSHRIKVAGGSSSIFTDTGWEAILLAFGSEGIPRVVNLLCDRSLNVAFERGKSAADAHDVYEATKGMKSKGLEKEVFHYIVTLKNIERQGQSPSESATDTVTVKKISENKPVKNQATVPRSSLKTSPRVANLSLPSEYEEPKNLKMPLFIFLLSVVTLIFSVMFYCHMSASPDLMTCLTELTDLIP